MMDDKSFKRKMTSLNCELVELHNLISLTSYEISIVPAWNLKRHYQVRRELKRLKRQFSIVEIEGNLLIANWIREKQEEENMKETIDQIFKELEH